MSCPRCGNNTPKTVIYQCNNCKTIYCLLMSSGFFPNQSAGCADNSSCPNCRKSAGSNARKLRTV